MRKPSRRQLLAATPALLAARSAFSAQLHDQEPSVPTASDYLLDESVTYLNHASIGTIPRAVHRAHTDYLAACETNPWLHVWGDAWTEASARTYGLVGALLGAAPDQVALIRNATAAFGMAANGLPLGAGDEVLYSSLNHVGATASWQSASESRGFSVRRFHFPIDDPASLSTDDVTAAYLGAISDATRALVIPHVDNIFGLRHDVKAIAAGARERGVEWILVDAAQSVGMFDIDFKDLGVDVYATSAHKWLQAPKGTGVMALSKAAIAQMRPLVTTWGHERSEGTARLFTDFGTRDMAKLLTIGDAIEFHQRTNEGREERLGRLREDLMGRVDSVAKFEWRSPRSYADGGASVVAVGLKEGSARDVARALFEDHRIVVRGFTGPGMNHVRVSPNALNTEADIERLWSALG